jgi:hypothetical protein
MTYHLAAGPLAGALGALLAVGAAILGAPDGLALSIGATVVVALPSIARLTRRAEGKG